MNLTLGRTEGKDSTRRLKREQAIKIESPVSTKTEAMKKVTRSDFLSKVKKDWDPHGAELKKTPKDDELDLAPVKQVPSQNERMIPENPDEETPPDLHFAGSPDPMDLASTVTKKFRTLKEDEDVLKLRFPAGLNLLEMIHKTENQISPMNHSKEAVEFLPDAKNFPVPPKLNRKFRPDQHCHSFADSKDSPSTPFQEVSSDHSNMGNRISTLEEEALKKQIKAYDHLIRKGQAAIIETSHQPSGIPPQIKSPKRMKEVSNPEKLTSYPVKVPTDDLTRTKNCSDDFTSSRSVATSVKPDAQKVGVNTVNSTSTISWKTMVKEGESIKHKRPMSLKPPLFPKSNKRLRAFQQHHLSAGHGNSLSLASHDALPDQGNMGIRIRVLKEELECRKATVAMLKVAHVEGHKEEFRMQEEMLRSNEYWPRGMCDLQPQPTWYSLRLHHRTRRSWDIPCCLPKHVVEELRPGFELKRERQILNGGQINHKTNEV